MAEPDGTPAGYGYSYADMCGRIHGRARGAGRAVASTAHGQRPVRRSVAVRGGRERRRSRAARHLGQRAHAVGAGLQIAGRSGRAARRLQMPRRSTATTIDGSRSAFAPDPNGVDSSSRSGRRSGRANAKFRTLYMRMQNSAELDAQRLAMDRGAQRRRCDGDTAARGNRSGRRREWRRHVRARSAAEGARLLAGGLDQEGRDDARHRNPVQAFRRVGRSSARSRPKSARISTTSWASCSASAKRSARSWSRKAPSGPDIRDFAIF